jgi:hypothetical protein
MRHWSSPLSQSWPTSFESMSLPPGALIIEVDVSKTMRMLGLTTWCWIKVTGLTSAREVPGTTARAMMKSAAPAALRDRRWAEMLRLLFIESLRAPRGCRVQSAGHRLGGWRKPVFKPFHAERQVGRREPRSHGLSPEVPQTDAHREKIA